MGKRSDFSRFPRDFYPTPIEATLPLFAHLRPNTKFVEPCAGNGIMVLQLERVGHKCLLAIDIEPQSTKVSLGDAFDLCYTEADCFITNPPWDRSILHPLIIHLSNLAPTWLLFDADWVHTQQAKPFLPRLSRIVSIGRVRWIPNSTMTGKDNCCWHLFTKGNHTSAEFFGRL